MSNIKHASIIVVTGRNYDKQGLLHLLDSQAAVAILRKGASKSPECHRLVLQIYNKSDGVPLNPNL